MSGVLFFASKKGESIMSTKTKSNKTRLIAGCGMLTAVAFVLQYIEISLPIMPSFIKLDFSDLPELIASFAYGPLAGILIAVLKNVIHMPFGSSACIGELSNAILGCVFSGVAGVIYKRKKTKAGAFVAGAVASIVMAIVSLPSNYFIIYPLYYKVLGFPESAILSMYQVIMPNIKSIAQALVVFNVPFTLVKGLICVAISMIIYQPIRPLLKGKK
jgi:riboflavin transporter FmnP